MRRVLFCILATLVLSQLFLYPLTLQAQIDSPLRARDIPEFIQLILDQALPIVLAIAVMCIMYGGFIIATAGGSESKYSQGKSAVMWAVVGLLVVVAAKAIVDGFLDSTGLK